MSTTIGGVRIVDMPDLGAFNDASSVVGERAGSGRFSATALKSYVASDVNVRSFGATGNGSTDDTAAFNAALASIAAGGGNAKLYIPAGNYKITGTLSDFRVLTPYATSTHGGLFNFTSASFIRLDRITTNGGFGVVQFLGSAGNLSYRTTITNCHFDNVMGNAVFYDQYFGGFGMISDTEIQCTSTLNTTGNGIIIEAGDTFTFTNINISGFPFGINVTSQPGGINYAGVIHAANVLCSGNGLPGTTDGWLLQGGAGGTYVSRIRLTNCWADVMGRHGFDVANASDVTFTNCIAIANGQDGFMLATPSSDLTLKGCTAVANSASGSATYDGIRVVGPVTDFIISGCRCRPNAGFVTSTQGYGINVDATANNRYIISNNNLHGNVTGGLADSSAGSPTRFVSQNIV
jgi:hypothetical protein